MERTRRSRWFTFALVAGAFTIALMAVSPWWSVGWVQRIGQRSVAVGFEDARLGVGFSEPGNATPSAWFLQRFDFGFYWWFEIAKPSGATYLAVPLWAPLVVFIVIAWRHRRRIIPPGHCASCGYELAGLKTCPECGRQTQPQAFTRENASEQPSQPPCGPAPARIEDTPP